PGKPTGQDKAGRWYQQKCYQDMPRQRHVRRHSVVAHGRGVKPPKPGVSRYGRPDITDPPPALRGNAACQR
ncbi:hypothetical protein ACRTTH_004364, partial [Escherichia coli]